MPVVLALGFALLVGGHSYWAESRRWWVAAAAIGLAGWVAATVRWVPRVLVAVLLLAVTAVELQQARPNGEYRQLVPDAAYDDPGPVMERLGRERGRYVSTAWDRPTTAGQRRMVAATVPAGYTEQMRQGWIRTWPRRLAARPAWEYATNAETISGRDGGLMPLRTYQEFLRRRRRPQGPPHRRRQPAGAVPVGLGRPRPDGVRWFVTASLPRPRSRSSASTGSGRSTGRPTTWSGSGRRRRWRACAATWT